MRQQRYTLRRWRIHERFTHILENGALERRSKFFACSAESRFLGSSEVGGQLFVKTTDRRRLLLLSQKTATSGQNSSYSTASSPLTASAQTSFSMCDSPRWLHDFRLLLLTSCLPHISYREAMPPSASGAGTDTQCCARLEDEHFAHHCSSALTDLKEWKTLRVSHIPTPPATRIGQPYNAFGSQSLFLGNIFAKITRITSGRCSPPEPSRV